MIPVELQRAMAAIEKLEPEWEVEGNPGAAHPWSIRFSRKREDGITVVYIAIGDVDPHSRSGKGARVRIVHYPGMGVAPDFWRSSASDEGEIIFDEHFRMYSQSQDRREAYEYLREYQKRIVVPVIKKQRELREIVREAKEKVEKAHRDAFWKSVGVPSPEKSLENEASKEKPQVEGTNAGAGCLLIIGLVALLAFLVAMSLLGKLP